MSERLAPAARLARWIFILLCKALPVFFLAWMILVQVRDGVDLPYLDDWRDYAASTVGTYSVEYLFRPANDTLYPIGKLLDSIFLDALNGNTLIYQALSMTLVLGAILALTWFLLRKTVVDPFLAACAFVPVLLVLQGDSYWGRQYVAYHQAVPLVCLLGVLTIVVATAWRPAIRMAAVFALGIIAGGAYISGAFASLGAALVLVAIGLLRRHRRDALEAGGALLIASIITSAAQAYVIVVIQGGRTHHPDATWATPMTPDFWLYALGKIGRSLTLPYDRAELSLVVASLLTVATAILAIVMLWRLATVDEIERPSENLGIVIVCLAVALAVYLAIVAAGRAHLRPPEFDEPLEIFQAGYARFHFFWATLMWPWVFASALIMFRRSMRSFFPLVAVACTVGIAIGVIGSGALKYRVAFAQGTAVKQRGIECLQDRLLTADEIYCPELYPIAITNLYLDAVEAGAPFTYAAPPTLRRYNQLPRLRLLGPDQLGPDRTKVHNADDVAWHDGKMTIDAASDPMVEFRVYRRRAMGACRVLDVSVKLEGETDRTAQLFYMTPNEKGFHEGHSQIAFNDGASDLNFTVSSAEGFADLLRLDPIGGPGEVTISDLTVTCLLP